MGNTITIFYEYMDRKLKINFNHFKTQAVIIKNTFGLFKKYKKHG